jgi:parallel beta-helix repeat protein
MRARAFLTKASISIATVVVSLGMAAPPVTQAAASMILVDDNPFASDCGTYTGKAANPDLLAAVNGAASGSTVLICPGLYDTTGPDAFTISGKKLTIKRALTTENSRPIVVFDASDATGMAITESTVTIDGVILDMTGTTNSPFFGVNLVRSNATIKNVTVLGPTVAAPSFGIIADNNSQTVARTVSISNSTIAGFTNCGVRAVGPIKIAVSGVHVDITDGGRVTTGAQVGICLETGTTGSVTKSRIFNADGQGIWIYDSSKLSITNNLLSGNATGVLIQTVGTRNMDSIKISGNTIVNLSAGGNGIAVQHSYTDFSISKLSISKNVIVASRYGDGGVGIVVGTSGPSPENISGSIDGNIITGVENPIVINNGPWPGLIVKKNDIEP